MGPRRRWRARTATAAVVATGMAVLAAAGACSDGDGGDRAQPTLTTPSTTATTAPPSTTTTEAEPERVEAEPPPGEPRPDIDVNVTYPADFDQEQIEVVEAYRGFWHAVYAASDPPDPDHPLLANYMTVERLEGVQAGLRTSQERGVVVRIPEHADYRHVVTDVEVTGATAVIHDCAVDDAVVINVDTSDVVDDDVVTRELEISAEKIAGVWRISGRVPRTVQEWQGVAGCAEQLS